MFSGGFLAGGIGTIFFGVLAIVGGIIGGIPLAIFGGAIMSILGLFGTGVGLQGIFSPSPTIPIWVWLVGFIVLMMMFKKK